MAETKVLSEVTGTAWRILVAEGQRVARDEELMIAEAMKMEIPLAAPAAGTVKRVLVAEGAAIEEDQPVFVLET